jgi:carboxypeptidase PM20D1
VNESTQRAYTKTCHLVCRYIWGRGTLDVKYSVVALLEAATQLIEDGFQPKRTMYFAFGQDEEVRGRMEGGEGL